MISYIVDDYMKMIRFYISLLLVVTFFSVGARASEDALKNSNNLNPVYKANKSIMSYFEPVSGIAAEVDDNFVKVEFENGKNIKSGVRLSAFREGDPFYHPVTNELLGRTESIVGRVEIEREIDPGGLYLCRIIKGEIKTGDSIRRTSTKTKLAFFQDRKADWGMSEAFYGLLKDSGRFEIVETYAPSYTAEDLSELARNLDAEAFLMLSTPVEVEKKTLSVKLYWADDAKLFGVIEEVVGDATFSAFTSGEEFILDSVSSTDPLGSYRLPGGRLLAMGDVNGNGANELLISDGRSITVYDYRNDLKELWVIKSDPEDMHISMDVIDSNKNGRAEILVTTVKDWKSMSLVKDDDNRKPSESKRGRVVSYIIEYDSSGGYGKIMDDIPYFLRVVGKTVLMQKYTSQRIFSGPVFEAKWENGNYVPYNPLNLPDDVNIYGFIYIDWRNDGQKNVITFNNHGLLMLYDDGGDLMWKGKKKYGTFDVKFKSRTYSVANPVMEWVVRGRLIAVQTERGQEVIVVDHVPYIENMPGVGGLGIKEAKVYSLWWDGGAMDEKVVLDDLSGAVSDYRVDRNELFLIARGDFYTFINNVTSGDFTKGSILYYYNFSRAVN